MGTNKKKVTNEELCAALMAHGTIKATAAYLNVSEKTVYKQMDDMEFRQLYEHAQADIYNNAVRSCQNRLEEAVDCISDIMNDKRSVNVNAQTRLLAAQTILKTSVQLFEVKEKLRDKAARETYGDPLGKYIWDDVDLRP